MLAVSSVPTKQQQQMMAEMQGQFQRLLLEKQGKVIDGEILARRWTDVTGTFSVLIREYTGAGSTRPRTEWQEKSRCLMAHSERWLS